MQVTDQTIIDRRSKEWGELQDGLQVFCGQGKHCIEMVVMFGQEPSLYEGLNSNYEHYEITVREETEELDLTELAQFPEKLHTYYKDVSVEFYDSSRSAHARLMQLIAEHNGF